ncbi:amidohydrolase [Pseudoruegeria sp. HB172150]|uniref:amidohydrolase n=1 Tax=Pseudoruegeria sp. HB172150 TaxID=2721164 RepID=UPI001C1306E4|nr:amidohydrolase [Pseudoruegeria sp. HB172150]
MTIADRIIVNGAVLTMDSCMPNAEAIAIADDRILAVGSNLEIEALAGPETDRIDANGATVLPGFIESHMHLFIGGAELGNLHLDNCADPDRMRGLIRDYAASRPDLPLVVCQSPDYGVFGDTLPRVLLDIILPDRPLALVGHDHHTVWANTAALDAAGILNGMETDPGHEVVMGPDGLATGALYEPQAYEPVMCLGGQERMMLGLNTGRDPDPAPTDAEREEDLAHLKRGLDHCAAQGITSIVNMDGNVYTLELLEELRSRGELNVRVRVPFHFVPDMEVGELETARLMNKRWNDDWLSCGFVKFFMDGVIDSGTAFMTNDYPGRPGHRSTGRFTAERFADLATRVDALGLQIAVHAIGDAAIARTLDGIAAARAANGSEIRHRIEHLELVAPEDFDRLAELGVTASIQPAHAPGCAGLPLEPTLTNIGRDRWKDAFAWQRLAGSGALIALASDWPVADVSVMVGLHAAVTREAWVADVPDHRFKLEAALAGYTIGGAKAEQTEAKKGSLREGKLADIVILDGDITGIPSSDIGGMRIRTTICGGAVTYHGTG